MPSLIVLTGAPGTGKTAILNALRGEILCMDEPAREVLAQQRASGGDGVPDQNPSKFVDLLLRRSIAQFDDARAVSGPVLFDRGVPDCVAYARILGTSPAESVRAAKTCRYHGAVLVTRPWAEIYTTDEERKMTFDGIAEFQRRIETSYHEAGYDLVEVPRGSIEDRAEFVRAFIAELAVPR